MAVSDDSDTQLTRAQWAVLGGLVLLVALSFGYGWWMDDSVPRGGVGWADQSLYRGATNRLASGHLPTAGMLHYQLGYTAAAAVLQILLPGDPFAWLSFVLLMSSAVLVFLGAVRLMPTFFAAIAVIGTLAWDFQGRTFESAAELFVIPWNNQVVFFAFAFFFWLFVRRDSRPGGVTLRVYLAAAFVAALCVATRNETVLFMVPLLVAFLVATRAGRWEWIATLLVACAVLTPELLVRATVLGSPFDSGRPKAYSELASSYLDPGRLLRNVRLVLVNSSWDGPPPGGRQAILQASPWLWVAPVGLGVLTVRLGRRSLTTLFLLVSAALLVFYLAGTNMSVSKLQFHCIRYVTPALISLNIAAAYAAFVMYDRLLPNPRATWRRPPRIPPAP